MIPFLDPDTIHEAVNVAIDEDLGRGDITTLSTIRPGQRARGSFLAKQDFVLAGLEIADAVFARFDFNMQIETSVADGDALQTGKVFARVTGEAQTLLMAERTALNFLQRLSGIATITRRYVEAIEGTRARIVDTRKTTPGLRMLEKYAVATGGGKNHRLGLDDGVLIKDNHIALGGGLTEAIRRARESVGHLHKIEVEVATLDQLREALRCGADIVMLDNMPPQTVAEAVRIVNEHEPGGRRTLLEASGGIHLENVRAYAETGVDLISIGALTHSAPAVDISFKIKLA
ncbi:MAG: carboxylating nicotinate-nucleotide diphosphorylase [Blastocatellia bacterium]